MKLNSCRGAIPVVVLYLAGALGLTQLVPNWRVGNLFAKGPQTKELAQAQLELAKAKAEAQAAALEYQAALKAKEQGTTAQLRFSQQFAAGIPPLLAKAPQTPEVVLAQTFAVRVNRGMALAIGDLPADKQVEILNLIDDALSAKQAEVDAAKAKIAQLDLDLAVTTKEKQAVEARLPAILQAKEALEAKVEVQTATVAQKTAEVVQYADKAAEKAKEAGSLGALVTKLLWVLGFIGALYVFVHFMLPSLAQEFPGSRWLTGLNKGVKSVVSAHL